MLLDCLRIFYEHNGAPFLAEIGSLAATVSDLELKRPIAVNVDDSIQVLALMSTTSYYRQLRASKKPRSLELSITIAWEIFLLRRQFMCINPVGSTWTVVAGIMFLYQTHISKEIAGILLSGILSDCY